MPVIGRICIAVASGEFSNIENNPIRQTVDLPPVTTRYVRFLPTRLCQGDKAVIADFKLIESK